MATQAQKTILQEVFILATGSAANPQQLAWLESLTGPEGSDYSRVAQAVDDYMNSLVPTYGVSGLVKMIAKNGLGLMYSDAEAESVTHYLIGQGIDSWSKLFAFCVNLDGTAGTVLDNRGQAAINFGDTLTATNKSSYFAGAGVSNAVKTLLQNIGASAESLNSGTVGLDALATNLTATGIKSALIDGYVSGATVFADANGDGVLNAGEWSTTTDASGNYELPSNSKAGTIIAYGGTDLFTGQAFKGVLSAPAGSTVVTPLTSLLQFALANNPDASVEQAMAKLQAAFILPTGINLLSYDPMTTLASSTASAADKAIALTVQAASLQVANLVVQVSSALDAAGSTTQHSAATEILSALAGVINGATGAVNLSQTSTLTSVIEAAQSSANTPLNPTLVQQLAQIAASSNAAVANATNVVTLSQAAVVAQGSATDAIVIGATSGNLTNAVSNFTGGALTNAINTATTGYLDAATPIQAPPQLVDGGGGSSTDITAPEFQSAATSTDGTKVILTYNEKLGVPTAVASAFIVKVDGSAATINTVMVSGSTVEISLASALTAGQVVTVAYTDPTASDDANAIQDAAGNDAVSLAATNVTITVDTMPPTAYAFNTTSTTVGATSTEAGLLGLYDGNGNLLASAAGHGATLKAFMAANTATSITAEAQTTSTSATLKVSDSAGNFAADTRNVILGTTGADSLTGTTAEDFIFGFDGPDTITGGTGADSIVLGFLHGAPDTVTYTASGETDNRSVGFFAGGLTSGMDVITQAAIGDKLRIWDGFLADGTTVSTTYLTATTANKVAIVQGTLDEKNGFTAGAGDSADDYTVQWADGIKVYSVLLKNYGKAAPTLKVDPATDTLTLASAAAPPNPADPPNPTDTTAPTITAGPTVASATTISLTVDENSTAGIYSHSIPVGLPTGLIANTAGTLTVAAQTLVTSAALNVIDDVGNSTASAVTVLLGRNNEDSLAGDESANLIFGFDGNDTITGNDGDDTITGGADNDTLTGGEGFDRFIIDADTDTITDLTTNDSLVVFPGATANAIEITTFFGDTRTRQDGAATLSTAAAGGTIILGDASGTTGFTLSGGPGNDFLSGSARADTIIGGAGLDKLNGGKGDDTFVVDSGTDLITDFGTDADVLQVAAGATAQLLLGTGGANSATTGSANAGTIDFYSWALDTHTAKFIGNVTGGGITRLIINGENFEDISDNDIQKITNIIINSKIDDKWFKFDQQSEDLMISVGSTGAWVNILGGTGDDSIQGGAGKDVIDGSFGKDLIIGDDGNDIIKGGDGNDHILGGAGADDLNGGDGDDVFEYEVIGDFVASNAVVDSITGSDGTDTIQVNGSINIEMDDSLAHVETVEILASAVSMKIGKAHSIVIGMDENLGSIRAIDLSHDINADSSSLINLTGVNTDMALRGVYLGQNNITGGGGDDYIRGGEGDDIISGGAGIDTLYGGDGADTFVFAAGDSNATSGTDHDKVVIFDIAGGDRLDLAGSAKPQNNAAGVNVTAAFDSETLTPGPISITGNITNGLISTYAHYATGEGKVVTTPITFSSLTEGLAVARIMVTTDTAVGAFDFGGLTYVYQENTGGDLLIELNGLTGITAVGTAAAENTLLIT